MINLKKIIGLCIMAILVCFLLMPVSPSKANAESTIINPKPKKENGVGAGFNCYCPWPVRAGCYCVFPDNASLPNPAKN